MSAVGRGAQKGVPGIAWAAPCSTVGSTILTVGEKNLTLRIIWAGADFLNICRFPLVEGNADQALQAPNSVVLTQSTAKALFGNTDPIGKTVLIFQYNALKVTAVIKDIPHNSTLQFDFIGGVDPRNGDNDWRTNYWHVFVGLQPNVTSGQVEARARFLVKAHAPAIYRTSHEEVIMQAFKDRHLWTDYENGVATGGLISYVRLFGNTGADSLSTILNKTAVKRMRLKQPIGQVITYSNSGYPQRMRIIGVVKDVINQSPFAPVEPTMFVFQPNWTFCLTYRLAPNVNTHVALAKLQPIFEKFDPRVPYVYHFTDDEYASMFHSELLIGRLAAVFAGPAILISCLGLFGLAAYVAEQRKKEISIRRVLGAPVPNLLLLLTKDFIIVVGLSCVIAAPIAWFLLRAWLQQYYYRICIGPGVFVLAAVIVLVLTVVTVSVQASRAALANPTDSLRAERGKLYYVEGLVTRRIIQVRFDILYFP